MTPRVHVRLTSEPLSPDTAQAFVTLPAAGAVVCFTGTVRAESEGRTVAALSYEAYEEHASRQMQELAADLCLRWPAVTAVFMEHRTGTLAIGEPAVVVAVSAPHREEAFAAARDGIDTLKATVAIWKREHWADGTARWPGLPGLLADAGTEPSSRPGD